MVWRIVSGVLRVVGAIGIVMGLLGIVAGAPWGGLAGVIAGLVLLYQPREIRISFTLRMTYEQLAIAGSLIALAVIVALALVMR